MFYGSNSWSYTRLGKIDGLSESELRTFLKAGESNIGVTLSLNNATGIASTEFTEKAETTAGETIFNLQGRRVSVASVSSEHSVPPKGVYIKNGKKLIR